VVIIKIKYLAILFLLLSADEVSAMLDTNTVCSQPGINIGFLECAALVNLYNITDGDNWLNNSNWGNADINSWFGVSAFGPPGSLNVWFLQLGNNNLNGIIPGTLGELFELRILDLSNNNLFSFVPSQLGDLNNLEVILLGNNFLDGSVPVSIGQIIPQVIGLSTLTDLWIDNNSFIETLPTSINQMESLEFFSAHNVGFFGPIPLNIVELDQLEFLFLPGNDLIGKLPTCIGEMSSLRQIDLSFNQLNGHLPISLGELINFDFIILSGNAFSGVIPESWSQMALLQGLYLNENLITGQVPVGFGNMGLMNEFFLYGNQMTGDVIPPEIDAWFQQIPLKDITPQGTPDQIFYADFDGSCGF